ncbi:putative ABC transporter ATP-binding protein [Oceanicola granulosus HTCC2516]|uniref:Putative ABC transporter ATP-binding protein n=1 Tax=Oceanicola granulosus (strain ATCC BAA-861 / DSM 15982 / KCTC 12143 / HTCC2516) TaxID=314256 RepID=Q2CBU8_OCEGH|nr:sugar ABC transporter ATP-binding protein [Oceanicola granulosus]EAR50172.1 putative ABC transporter ATP-binding protein [Oceanicola granulosus HTCC2516]
MHRLTLDQVSRRFGEVAALDGVDLTLVSGEVHALMGENGAGKSTLIRTLAGLDRPDTGRLALDGTPLPAGNPAAMRAAGLRFIHQELHAVRGLSVAENMHLDHPYPRRAGLVDWRALNRAAAAALARLGLTGIDVRAPMTALGPGDQMLVRIASTLIPDAAPGARPAWLYVMDEPTAALTSGESERLFAVIGELVGQGAGILYVSHRMPEVLRLAHRVSVLRDGRNVSSRPLAETGEARIIEEMTGRDLGALFPPRPAARPAGEVVLRVADLAAGPLRGASLELRAGEILGLAGVAGSGRGALLRALIGALPWEAGSAELAGRPLGRGPARAWAEGLAYVPRERRTEGLMLRRPIAENVALPYLARLARLGLFLDHRRQRRLADELGGRVRLKAASVAQACEELSGGNQQKVLFARALAGGPRVLLLDEPTRGVDIGARAELYRLIRGLADTGLAVLMASSDLPELLGLSDRIAVLRDGRLAETVPAEGLTEAALLARFYHDDGAVT